MSYGTAELDNCLGPNDCHGLNATRYQQLVDTQWLKIGLLGVSLIAASGDAGTTGELPDSAPKRVIPFQAGSVLALRQLRLACLWRCPNSSLHCLP